MTKLEKYKLANEKLRFLVGLWLLEDCGCTCDECKELLEAADKLLEKPDARYPRRRFNQFAQHRSYLLRKTEIET